LVTKGTKRDLTWAVLTLLFVGGTVIVYRKYIKKNTGNDFISKLFGGGNNDAMQGYAY